MASLLLIFFISTRLFETKQTHIDESVPFQALSVLCAVLTLKKNAGGAKREERSKQAANERHA